MCTMLQRLGAVGLACLFVMTVGLAGCQTNPSRDTIGPAGTQADGAKAARRRSRRRQPVIRSVRCLFAARPWLNLDKAGDRDPEGIVYRVFLDPGTGKGVLADGVMHIELYQIDRRPGEGVVRTLASDWHYPTSAINTIGKPGLLGKGYVVQLRWATKDVAGHEIELVTKFEDPYGNLVQSATKRMRVPKYQS